MEPWNKLLEHADPDAHLLQFYQADERPLVENVSQYAAEGLKKGEGLVLIADQSRNQAIAQKLKELGIDLRLAIFVDVHQGLAGFMRDRQPDWELFQGTIGATVRKVKARAKDKGIRAYGEMVGVLWAAGQYAAAIRLEHYWNELRHSVPFQLFCAYPIDVFASGFRSAAVGALLCTHTHLLPGGAGRELEDALNRAMDEVLGTEADGVKALIQANRRPSWAQMPPAEGTILWLRSNLPERADQIVDLARQYCASQSLVAHIN